MKGAVGRFCTSVWTVDRLTVGTSVREERGEKKRECEREREKEERRVESGRRGVGDWGQKKYDRDETNAGEESGLKSKRRSTEITEKEKDAESIINIEATPSPTPIAIPATGSSTR